VEKFISLIKSYSFGSSNGGLVSNRSNSLGLISLQLHGNGFSRRNRQTLEVQLLSLGLGVLLLGSIVLDSLQKVLSRAAVLDVFDAHVDSLLEISVSHWTVEDDTDGGLGDVVDDSGLAVVDFVWHALLHGSVGYDVDDISYSGECGC